MPFPSPAPDHSLVIRSMAQVTVAQPVKVEGGPFRHRSTVPQLHCGLAQAGCRPLGGGRQPLSGGRQLRAQPAQHVQQQGVLVGQQLVQRLQAATKA